MNAYPNPARDRMMITYPADLMNATLEVLDAQGRSVRLTSLSAHTGFVELDVHAWADGLYLARVLANGDVIGETKCTIAR